MVDESVQAPARSVRRSDVVTAVSVAVVAVVWLFVSPLGWRSDVVVPGDAVGVLVVLGMTLPLAFRGRWPVGVLLVAALCSVGGALGGYATDPADLFLLFGVGAAASVTARRTAIVLGVALVAYQLWWRAAWILPDVDVADVLVAIAAGVLPPVVGDAVRTQRTLTEERLRHQDRRLRVLELEAARAAEGERLRIARELHDIVGHHLSAIGVQARGIATLVESSPEQARAELNDLAALASAALQETRSSVEQLRAGPSGAAAPGGLSELDDLLDGARRSDTEVTLAVSGDPARVPDAVSRCTFRLVQESLTNVARHARPRAADVEIAVADGALRLRVESRFDDRDGARPGDGNGLVGMRERVAAVGGTLHAGPIAPGRWAVDATLPFAP